MINFDFDVKKLIRQYLPIVLRKPKMLAFLYALFTPINTLKDTFLAFIERARREIMQTGQVISLESLLNDLFDFDLRRIRITDTSNSAFVLSNKVETILSDSEQISIADTTDFNFLVDFVVKLVGIGAYNLFILSDTNTTIVSNVNAITISDNSSNPIVNQVENIVKRYKIAGKTFEIETI